MKNKKKIVILGAGLSGLSTGYFLKEKGRRFKIFEKKRECGGLCRSFKRDGFTFDFSGHLLHFRTSKISSLVRGFLGNNLIKHRRNAYVYAFNKFIPYPFQVNFYHLPKKQVYECLRGFIEACSNGKNFVKNDSFLGWINKIFGHGIAKHFMIPYNLKFWKTPLEELSSDWVDRFVITPSLKDILVAGGKKTKNLGYHACFWYPKKGGIEELIKGFTSNLEGIHLSQEVVEIDLDKREVKFKDGGKERFGSLLSSIPLPVLSRIIKGLPKNILSDFKKLKWLSILNVNFGIEGKVQPERHWIYFPQKDVSFFRAGLFHNFSSTLAPCGKSSLYTDVSYSKDSPIDKKNIASRIKKDLKKVGLISSGHKIVTQNVNDVEYAYPIYDRNYNLIRANILKFLSKNNITSCGRFGSWRYMSMEDVISESEEITEKIA
ncbi:MAG: FAD-dependent oxidoreductase [Candidatus Omnitrophica bacterium]|nr:FAD-dependent oxidoreductase [Candidatus Omnitrophota bacterium]